MTYWHMIHVASNPAEVAESPFSWHTAPHSGMRTSRCSEAVSIAGLALILVCGLPARISAQRPPDANKDPVLASWQGFASFECANCHFDGPVQGAGQLGDFCRQVEAADWVTRDKHAIARRRVEPLTREEVLAQYKELKPQFQWRTPEEVQQWLGASNILSRSICDRLGYDVTTQEGYARFRQNCLTCHGGYAGPHEDAAFARSGAPGSQQPGISCTFCHQLGDQRDWLDPHDGKTAVQQVTAWRLQSPEEKETQGFRDLVSTTSQATLCVGCHIGNRADHRFITHDMYAAGHPPLPSFELQTFCQSMPQHWMTSRQLHANLARYPQREEYFRQNFPELFAAGDASVDPGKTCWDTRTMLVSALESQRRSLELVADAAASNHWGDYALYDCSACHHELREQSPRQTYGAPGVPGRPRAMDWPSALFDVAAGMTTSADRISALRTELQAAYDRQPFGDPRTCGPLAQQLIDAIGEAQQELSARSMDAPLAKHVLWKLAETPKSKLVDYHTARQVVWAMLAIDKELAEMGRPLPSQVRDALRQLENPDGGPIGIATRLPAGREVFIYRKNLDRELQLRSVYSPEPLAVALSQVLKYLRDSNDPPDPGG